MPKCWPLESLKWVEVFPPGLFRLVSAVMPALRHRERGPVPGRLPRAHQGDAPRPLRGDPLGETACAPLGVRSVAQVSRRLRKVKQGGRGRTRRAFQGRNPSLKTGIPPRFTRRFTRRFYPKALPHVTFSHFSTCEWTEPGSNRRPKDFQSFALPAELSVQVVAGLGLRNLQTFPHPAHCSAFSVD